MGGHRRSVLTTHRAFTGRGNSVASGELWPPCKSPMRRPTEDVNLKTEFLAAVDFLVAGGLAAASATAVIANLPSAGQVGT